jgi:hypothetical protein
MNPQLQAVIDEYGEAQDRLHRLTGELPDEFWGVRPAPERWSASECVAHLNLTSRAFLPLMRDGVERARALGEPAPARYRRDPLGWVLWRTMGPPVRVRIGTAAAFVPESAEAPERLRADFDELQLEQVELVRAGAGLPLQRVKTASPFDARASYNLYAAMTILPRHQHRHLWQAEQVAKSVMGARPVSVKTL